MNKPLDPTLATQQRVVRRELAKRRRLPHAVAALEASLFPEQRAFVMTKATRVASCSGRRSGKTHGLKVRAARAAAANPGAWIPIVERTTTCQSAQLIWRGLQDVNEAYGLKFTFHHTLLIATAPNRARIQIVGADTVEAADKLRGEHPPEVLIDEAGTFRPHILRYLLHEVIQPALMDYQGTLVMAGTPNPRKVGPFAEACGVLPSSTASWERHHWTYRENDALPLNQADRSQAERLVARDAWFDALLRENGWTIDSPWVQREYLGNWAEDSNNLVYRLGAHNHAGILTPDTTGPGWYWGLGLDFGYDDATSFVVGAWRRGDPVLWILESYQQRGLIPSAVAAHVERLRARFRFSFIVGDTGGYGKGPAEEMRQRYGIPIESAKKRGKEVHVAFVNGDLTSGVIRIVERASDSPTAARMNEDLIADLYALRRAEGSEWKEDERDDNHLPDGFLYLAMHQRGALGGLGPRDAAVVGSAEWLDAREAAMDAEDLERWSAGAGGGAVDALSEAVDALPEG